MKPSRLLPPVRVACALAALLAAAPAVAQAQAPALRTVALSGRPAPEAGGGTWSAVGQPLINDRGEIAFIGQVGGGEEPRLGVWLNNAGGTPGGTRVVALDGQPAPEPGGEAFAGVRLAMLSDGGHVAVGANRGLWVGPPGGLRLLAREFDAPAPGTTAPFRFIPPSNGTYNASINAAGTVAMLAHLAHGDGATFGTDTGVWAGPAGDLRLVARQGTAPLGLHALDSVAVNDAGQLAVGGGRHGLPSAGGNWGVWTGRSAGDLTQVVVRDAPAPGLPGFKVGTPIGGVALANSGAMAFNAALRTDADNSAGNAIWRLDGGGLRLVARTGDEAPGLPGLTFNRLQYGPGLNDAGRLLFTAAAGAPGGDEHDPGAVAGLWAGTPDELRLIAAEGQAAPGTGGARFGRTIVQGPDGTEWQGAFLSARQNEAGQIAWVGSLVGEGLIEATDTAIFAADPAGAIALIAREGDLLDVGAGDLRRIDRLYGYGDAIGTWPEGNWFNDAGELTFAATFTDGSSGVFVVTVPEPGLGGVVLASGLLLLRRRVRSGPEEE